MSGKKEKEKRRSRRTEYEIDWTDSRSVMRSIYLMMSRYIDEFKRTVAFEECSEKSFAPDCPSRDDIEEAIYDCMLDMPRDIFDRLLSFSRGYLRDMNYDDEGYELIWERTGSSSEFVPYTKYTESAESAKMEADFEAAAQFDTLEDYFLYQHEHPFDDAPGDDYAEGNTAIWYEGIEKVEYVNYIADNAYRILEEILKGIKEL